MKVVAHSYFNVVTVRDVTIAELAITMAKVVSIEGHIESDTSKPDVTPRKLMDVSRLGLLGWEYFVALEQGLGMTCKRFFDHSGELRR